MVKSVSSKVAHTASQNLSQCLYSITRLGVDLLPPGWDVSPSQHDAPEFTGPIYSPSAQSGPGPVLIPRLLLACCHILLVTNVQ